MVKVITFAEMGFEGAFQFKDRDFAEGYCQGFGSGGGHFGGTAMAFIYPDDEAEMREQLENHPDELEKGIAAAIALGPSSNFRCSTCGAERDDG